MSRDRRKVETEYKKICGAFRICPGVLGEALGVFEFPKQR